MTLLTILAGLALEYFLGALDRFRNFTWFDHYSNWLELRCSKFALWSGPGGVILTLLLPLLVLGVTSYLLGRVFVLLPFLLAILVFVYSLGPDLHSLLNRLIETINSGDDLARGEIENQFIDEGLAFDESDEREEAIIRGIVIRAHENIFGVIFWYLILGLVGALLYSLVVKMNDKFRGIHGGYADAIRDLRGILMWPSARLLALGFALSGSLVHAFGGWRQAETLGASCNEDVIGEAGLGALQYHLGPLDDLEEGFNPFAGWVQEVRRLINRTLIIWLTVLGIMTLVEWIA